MNDTNIPENDDFSEDELFRDLKSSGESQEDIPLLSESDLPDGDDVLAEILEDAPEDTIEDISALVEAPVEAFDPDNTDFLAEVLSDPELSEAISEPILPEELPDAESGQDVPREKPSEAECESGEELAVPTDEQPRKRRSRPIKRGRPRRPKGSGLWGIPHLISSVLWLVMILAIGVSLGRMVWVCASDVLAFGRESKEVTVSITNTDTIDTIAQKLNEAGLIRYPGLFKLYAGVSHAEKKITTGTFTLNTIYDYHALVSQMSPKSSNRVVIEDVLIPEGYSCRQIFALLERKGICTVAELEEYAANGELKSYWFLENVERGDKYCLEGFLFPDTYDFYEHSSPKAALEKMLNGFQTRFTEELFATLPQLNERLSQMMRNNGCTEEYIAQNQLDLRQVLTVASLIEKEMATTDEAPVIASVIYNRLTQDEAYERYLNIDAAIFYALGEHKEALTAEDLQIDSPYNTYVNSGLVPGPIASPGLACINAALNPQSTDYYYYVLDPATGSHHFSKTYEEHEKFIASLGSGEHG